MFEVLLSHTQHIARISEEHIAALNILCHILVLTLLEVLQFLLIVSLNPTCLMQMNRLPTALGVVLVLQAILDNLELQLTDDATMRRPLNWLMNNCATPSFINCSKPFWNCLLFIGSSFSMYLKRSGENDGNPRKLIFSPSVRVSPILKMPLSGKPTISPG